MSKNASYKKTSSRSEQFKRKNVIQYLVRTSLAILLILVFWEQNWMPWVALGYLPLNLLGLLAIRKSYMIIKQMEDLEAGQIEGN